MAMAARNSCDIAGAQRKSNSLLGVVFSTVTEVMRVDFRMKIVVEVDFRGAGVWMSIKKRLNCLRYK